MKDIWCTVVGVQTYFFKWHFISCMPTFWKLGCTFLWIKYVRVGISATRCSFYLLFFLKSRNQVTRHSRTCEWSSKCLPGMIHIPTIFPCALNLISSSCFGVEWPIINKEWNQIKKKFSSCLRCVFFPPEIVMIESINCLCTCICVTAWRISSLITLPERPEGVRLRGLCRRWQIALLPTVSRQCVCHVPFHTLRHTHVTDGSSDCHHKALTIPTQTCSGVKSHIRPNTVAQGSGEWKWEGTCIHRGIESDEGLIVSDETPSGHVV